ncbi:TPA: hypothetical protein NJ338_002604 [Vibrio parahaemolyticus]|nr:hypothetical protein [Vibrio parahaemolyticus]HCG7108817.1 hypothetical protein [Vibrio parahaemolyticus]
MRAVEKHPSLAEHLFTVHRVQKYGFMILKHGLKGAAKKVNPAAIYLDAGLAVIDAVNSYLQYAKECQKTKQILAENRKIKIELENQLKILKIQQQTLIKDGTERIEHLNKQIKLNCQERNNMLQAVKKHIEIVKKIQNNLKSERENGVDFTQLKEAQQSLDHFLRSALMFMANTFE